MYELHLFEDRRLAGLARTQQQHLDLISETQLVSLQLVLNLLIPLLPLLRLGTLPATHGASQCLLCADVVWRLAVLALR